jgi:hypothetical protein
MIVLHCVIGDGGVKFLCLWILSLPNDSTLNRHHAAIKPAFDLEGKVKAMDGRGARYSYVVPLVVACYGIIISEVDLGSRDTGDIGEKAGLKHEYRPGTSTTICWEISM